jgi:general secretion pathway protein K
MNRMMARRLVPEGSPRHQRGAALLTAMIIVTLIATLASAMVWQQWRAVQIEAAERARTESAWVLLGALDWARLILREDLRSGGANANIDHLGEPWATPLAEARLSTFLAADKQNASDDDGPEAFLSGTIVDAQSRYDLMWLVNTNEDGKQVPEQFAILERLCGFLGLASSVAVQIDEGLRAAGSAAPAANAPLMPSKAEQLVWLGVDPASVAALAPYVTLLPGPMPVNVNTAPREVLAAVTGTDLATAERIVQQRQGAPFQSVESFASAIPGYTAQADALAVSTQYFEVRGRLRLADHVLEQVSLVQRINGQVNVKWTERVASTDPSGH